MKTPTNWLALVIALAAAAAALPAAAVTFDLSPFAELGASYERNLLRAETAQQAIEDSPTGDPRVSDSVRTASGGLTLEADHGLQAWIATAELSRADYNHFDELDHSAYDGIAGWRWAAGRALDGELGWRGTRRLDSFDNRDDSISNFRVERQVRASAGLAITPRFRAELLLRGDRRENTLVNRQRFDVEERLADFALLYVAQPVLRAGIGLRRVAGEYLRRDAQLFPDLATSYDDFGVDLRATWQPSGISTLDGRIGRTERELEPVQDQGFNGLVGHLEYRREISGKTSARLRAFRDLFAVEDVDANFIEDTGLRFGLTWAARSKLDVELTASYVDRVFAGGTSGANGARQRADDVRNGAVTVNWQVLERLALVADFEREIRQSNQAGDSAAWWRSGLALRLGF